MKYIIGDAFKNVANHDYILQGCNCFNAMGGGFAYMVAQLYPEAVAVDKATIRGDRNKLGNYTIGGPIINGYCQYTPGGPEEDTTAKRYEWIQALFTKVNTDFKGKNIAIPRIGAGIAGGDWHVISHIISQYCPDVDITVYLWDREYDPEAQWYYCSENVYNSGRVIYFKGQLLDHMDDECIESLKKIINKEGVIKNIPVA